MIDWASATREDKKVLYRHTLALKTKLGMSWNKVWDEAFGSKIIVGLSYEDNFRKGKISAGRAEAIFSWMDRKDPSRAKHLAEEIANGPGAAAQWSSLVEDHGRFDNVEVILHRRARGIVRLREPEPLSDLRLRLGDAFCFRVDCPGEGHLAGLQQQDGDWYPLEMAQGRMIVPVQSGPQTIPLPAPDGPLQTLSERRDAGMLRFVFLFSTAAEPLASLGGAQPGTPTGVAELSDCARRLSEADPATWALYRINLLIER